MRDHTDQELDTKGWVRCKNAAQFGKKIMKPLGIERKQTKYVFSQQTLEALFKK